MKTIIFRNINFTKVMGVNRYEIMKLSSWTKIINILRISASFVLKRDRLDLDKKHEVEFVFLKIQDREDYNSLFKNIFDQCSYPKGKLSITRVIGLNMGYIMGILVNVRLFKKFREEFSILDSTYFFVLANRYLEIMKQIDKYSFNALIVFSDVQPIENLFVQYCNFKNIRTVTMQHGLYVDYTNMPNINMLNYTDVSSKFLLAWGKSTEELFKKYNPDINVEICGKPLELKQNNIKKADNLLGVVFDQPMFRKYNQKMLQIACEIAVRKNIKIAMRLHPDDDKQHYSFNEMLVEYEKKVDDAGYVLAHTTSMIYEYLALGYKVFKMKSDIPANEINESLMFCSVEELANKLDMNFDFYKESLRHIGYVGDESKMKYKDFFDKLHENHLDINNSLE